MSCIGPITSYAFAGEAPICFALLDDKEPISSCVYSFMGLLLNVQIAHHGTGHISKNVVGTLTQLNCLWEY